MRTTRFLENRIHEIEIDRIIPSNFELRPVSEKSVLELMKSIKANGLLQPITVREIEGGAYQIIFGRHRVEACRRLGWKTIPALIRNVSEHESFLLSVVENLQRNCCINPVIEAKGYQLLLSNGWTIHEIAKKIGKSDSYVCIRMKVLDRLHSKILERLSQEKFTRVNSGLTISHIERLASIEDKERQLKLASLVERRKLSVRYLERLTRRKEISLLPKKCLCLQCSHYPCRVHDQFNRFLKSQEPHPHRVIVH